MRETYILKPQNVGLYTWSGGGRGSEKVYCLKILTFLDDPLGKYEFSDNNSNNRAFITKQILSIITVEQHKQIGLDYIDTLLLTKNRQLLYFYIIVLLSWHHFLYIYYFFNVFIDSLYQLIIISQYKKSYLLKQGSELK